MGAYIVTEFGPMEVYFHVAQKGHYTSIPEGHIVATVQDAYSRSLDENDRIVVNGIPTCGTVFFACTPEKLADPTFWQHTSGTWRRLDCDWDAATQNQQKKLRQTIQQELARMFAADASLLVRIRIRQMETDVDNKKMALQEARKAVEQAQMNLVIAQSELSRMKNAPPEA